MNKAHKDVWRTDSEWRCPNCEGLLLQGSGLKSYRTKIQSDAYPDSPPLPRGFLVCGGDEPCRVRQTNAFWDYYGDVHDCPEKTFESLPNGGKAIMNGDEKDNA